MNSVQTTLPTAETPEETPSTATVKKARKPKRSWAVLLSAPDDSATLKITLRLAKDGTTATTHVVHSVRDGKKRRNTRGATEKWPTLDAGRTAQERLVASALKLKWVRRERKSGFVAKPDAFTAANLPSPIKGKK